MAPLKKNELIDETSEFLPSDTCSNSIKAEELLNWNKKGGSTENCFRPLLTRRERWILESYNALDSRSAFGSVRIPFTSGTTPLRWKLILESLRIHGVPVRRQPLFLRGYNDVPRRYQASITIDTPTGFSDGKLFSEYMTAQGLSDNADIAGSKAVGEGLERYFLTVYRRKDLRYVNIRVMEQKRESFLNPLLYPQWNDEQVRHFPERLLDDKKTIAWVQGKSLIDATFVWLPAQMVYWSYVFDYPHSHEPMIMEPNTNGGGAHFTKTKAILSGVRELIQRDAFLVFWLRKVAPPRIDLATIIDTESRSLLAEFKECGLRVEVCDVTVDTGESVIVVGIIDESGVGPALSIAGGCDRNKELAIQSALHEALACYQGARRYPCTTELSKNYRPFFHTEINQRMRLLLANNPARRDEYMWFFQGDVRPLVHEKTATVTPEKELQDIVDFFVEKKWPLYYYEVKNNLLKKLGYTVVHVIAPKLIPLFLNEMNAPLAHNRLHTDFPKELVQGIDMNSINPVPHPFP